MVKKIEIKGPIISNDEQEIYDWFGMEATSPNKVKQLLNEANGEDVLVDISSGGGYVDSGSQIYTELKRYTGHVTTEVSGLAGSAASVILMSGNTIRISPTGQIMIHNASMDAQGDHRDMEHASEVLKVINKSIVNAYTIKTGKSEEELLDMMAKETWLSAKDALEHGFVDEIMFMEDSLKATASTGITTMLPQQVINNLRNSGIMNKTKQEVVSKEDIKAMFAEFKNEMLNELKVNKLEEPKEEPKTEPKNNSSVVSLFLNL
ncbi:head maturation protease, ClpP-related [Priestia megaterium]|uniref:head maturation protease, ClpP-related n=1 Tax=Priestia megaterium TaxID=1404 RepID=UPI000BFD863B|nr:head maturation protease, ClpP-related [Priestia megaterium]PGR01368.1 peptidase [Priestia megaterium]